MDSNMVFWFQGFEKGIAALEQIEREKLFRACGKNCVQQGTLAFYQELYQAAGGDVHRFFTAVNEFPGLRSETIEEQKAYFFSFEQCSCVLYTEGYVRSPLLCECSRQSILFALETIWPDKRFRVEPNGTILSGSKECKWKIILE